MKKNTLLITTLLIISFSKSFSQLPTASTAENPLWYYIQVEGESDRKDLVFTAENNKVYGRKKINSVAGETKADAQLWRFEIKNNKYTIINKASGEKIDAGYDSGKKISNMILSTASGSAEWEFVKNGTLFNIKSSKVPSGGSSNNVYAHQGNNWDNRNFVIMLESSSYNNTGNSKFQFIESEMVDIEYSSDNNEIWYYINSAKPEYEGKGITDVTGNGLPYINFSLETIEKENEYQQWKVVKKSSSPDEQYVHLVNKATGQAIQAKSTPNGFYKYTQAATELSTDKGWTFKYLGRKQFEISGTEEDGVVRYLNASTSEKTQPDFYEEEFSLNSSFAWLFTKVEDYWSAIPGISGEDDIRIYSQNRRIVVLGSDEYSVYTTQGIKVKKEQQLPVGIYLVTVNGKTTKLIVR